ncbi:MAG TPA: MlaD family protein [Bacteroidia bacterium]|jgi:phospholipid/cholesterol/gamma-HCH transport system substrate-binding protein|nr:MlaD family protein [Bacteroidia bacterium]
MKKETNRNIRLGIFVLAGTLFLVVALYMIGSKRNLFGNTFTLHADFRTVNGLMAGHNVRFSGIDVGTVKSIEFNNDSSVTVDMIIEEKYKSRIKKNCIAEIGTDGLMGNKLVNINPVSGNALHVEDGDILQTQQPIETDDMIRTLSLTNENMKVITDDLKKITAKINNSNSIWSLLADTIVSQNIRDAIVSIRITGANTALVTGDLSRISQNIRAGKGSIGALVADTTFYGQLHQSVVNIKLISDRMAIISGDMSDFTTQVKNGEGTVGMLMMDTTFVGNLNSSVVNLKAGTDNFNQNMEALKHSFLLRPYFRKQDKDKLPKDN